MDFVAAAIMAVAIVASLALAKLLSALSGLSCQPDAKDMEPYALGLLIIPALLVWAGFSISRLGLTGRLFNIALSVALLAGFPIGTFIGAILLFLIVGPKSWTIFSRNYKETVTKTPHLKPNLLFTILTALFSAIIGLFVSAAFLYA